MLTKKHTQDTQALEIFWLAARVAALEIFWLEASYSRKLLGNDSPGIPCEAEASTHFCTAAASPVDSGKLLGKIIFQLANSKEGEEIMEYISNIIMIF